MSKSLTKSFDYSQLDKDTKSDLIYFAGEILKARDAIGKSTVEMGGHLAAVQERLANHSGGVFVQWVETECGFSKSTAYRLISVYKSFGSFPNLGKLEDSALYALSENSTPEKARREVMKLADKGQSITHEIAKEIIAKYKQQEPRSEKGKPGGVSDPSSHETPVSDGPATSEPAADSDDEDWYDEGPFEDEAPAPQSDSKPDTEQEFRLQKSKTVKTCEALMRALDDLNRLKPRLDDHDWTIGRTKGILQSVKNW